MILCGHFIWHSLWFPPQFSRRLSWHRRKYEVQSWNGSICESVPKSKAEVFYLAQILAVYLTYVLKWSLANILTFYPAF